MTKDVAVANPLVCQQEAPEIELAVCLWALLFVCLFVLNNMTVVCELSFVY